jgi:23S rRNA (uracil1939-C5)-methyltransferase
MTKNGIIAGFYATKTHNVVPAYDCSLQPAIFGEILRFICNFANEKRLSVYNENTQKGLLRHLYLRYGKSTGDIMLCIVINGIKLPFDNELIANINENYPSVKSIQLNINTKNTNVVLGEKYITLYGERYIEDILCGVRFRITPESFYQVNHDGAEILYGLAKAKAIEGIENKLSLIDLYCGTGTIGLSMSDVASEIVGIEIVEGAVECAKENAKINGFENAKFYAGDAKDIESMFASVEAQHGTVNPDVVILDPPRKGCTPEVIEFLAKRDIKRIVYVSCDADTLARDCKLFSSLGYNIGEVDPVDMFPRTGHIENCVLISKV